MPVIITEYTTEQVSAITLTLVTGSARKNEDGSWTAKVGSALLTQPSRALAVDFMINQMANAS